MDPSSQARQPVDIDPYRHRHELERELTVMVLYVSIVLLATLAALPSSYGDAAEATRTDDLSLMAVVWGTAIGLALAHWFAFVVAAAGLRGGKLHRHDLELATAHVAGAAIVALTTTIPIVVTDDVSDVRAAAFAPAVFLGLAGYRVARSGGRSNGVSILVGAIGLLLGLAVAGIKAFLTH